MTRVDSSKPNSSEAQHDRIAARPNQAVDGPRMCTELLLGDRVPAQMGELPRHGRPGVGSTSYALAAKPRLAGRYSRAHADQRLWPPGQNENSAPDCQSARQDPKPLPSTPSERRAPA